MCKCKKYNPHFLQLAQLIQMDQLQSLERPDINKKDIIKNDMWNGMPHIDLGSDEINVDLGLDVIMKLSSH